MSIDWDSIAPEPTEQTEYDERDKFVASSVGDFIQGELARLEKVTTKFGDKVVMELDYVTSVRIAEVADNDPAAKWMSWTTPGMLDALRNQRADVGDIITITLVGLKDTGKGSPFKQYECEVIQRRQPELAGVE